MGMKRILSSVIVCLALLTASVFPRVGGLSAGASGADVGEIAGLIDGIIAFKLRQTGSASLQELIDGSLAENAGKTSEWYVLALSRYEKGCNFSKYAAALQRVADSGSVGSAVTRQKYALAFIAAGEGSPYITSTVNDSIGELGIMSRIYGLHLLNIGYRAAGHTASSVAGELLGLRLGDGGWALSGSVSDIDVTAMAVQALAPLYSSDGAVRAAVDGAVRLLSDRQLDTGDYMGFGEPNPESAAQVVTALSALNINPFTDGRFVKNGKTLLDGMLRYRLSDGSFAHSPGGGYNHAATVQCLYSLVAAWRQMNSLTPLYSLPYVEAREAEKTTSAPAAPSSPAAPVTPAAPTQPDPSSGGTEESGTAHTAARVDKTEPHSSAAARTSEPGTSAPTTAAPTTTAPGVSAPTAAASTTAAPTTAAEGESIADISSADESSVSAESSSAAVTRGASPSDATATNLSAGTASGTGGYKKWVCLAVWLVALAVCAALYFTGKRGRSNFICVLAAAALVSVGVFTINISGRDAYYGAASATDISDAVSVTLSIRCDAIAGESDKPYIPADGAILGETEFSVSTGSSVYDVLVLAARTHTIRIENDAQTGGLSDAVYISGINYIYEFDFGPLSGWLYRVNGENPSVGCGAYTVGEGDKIEWLYSKNIVEDLA